MAKVKSFRAETGVSVELKGQWYKFYTAIELELEEGDDTAEVKKKAWNTVHAEIEKQFTELLQG
jgi:hypothetical protein